MLIPPEIYVQRDQRAMFDYWLGQLDRSQQNESETVAATGGSQIQPVYHLESLTPLIASDSSERRWKIRCFGPLRVYRVNGDLVQWNTTGGATRKIKTLFAYLLYRGEEGARVEEIADLLWPETTDLCQSLNRLYHTIRCLRLALSPDLPSGRESPFLLHQNQHYFLAVPPNTWIDLPMFQELCYRGAAHLQDNNWEQALLCYQSAERLYTGDLLADIPDKYTANHEQDWCWSRRYWFRDMYHKLLYGTASIHRHLRHIAEAIAYADKALRLDPTSELAHQEKMRILAAANRQDALQRQYHLYCEVLEQFEMGPPSPATTQLYESLLKSLKN